MKEVWLTEEIEDSALKLLEEQKELFLCRQIGSLEEELQKGAQPSGLLLRTATVLDRKIIEKMPLLEVIARAGTGLDHLDEAAIKERGICLIHSPGTNAISAAEHSLGLLLAASRFSFQRHLELRKGIWNRSPGTEIYGKTLGILGFGNVGRELAKRAQGFGLKIFACDPYIESSLAKDYSVKLLSFQELLQKSDFLSLHIPLNSETRDILSEKEFDQMKTGAVLINSSRGACISEKALIKALDSGKLRAAALDVFVDEPLPPKSPLLSRPQVLLSPHIAGQTSEALARTHRNTVEQLIVFFKENKNRNEEVYRETK